MEAEEIDLVLARASRIRSKLAIAISDFAYPFHHHDLHNPTCSTDSLSFASILDSLESLQLRLQSLQVLQQRQRTERDACLAEIEENRRQFLRQLKAYRGKEVEIVEEAIAFAGGNVSESEENRTVGYQGINNEEVSESLYSETPDAEQLRVNVDIQQNGNEGTYDLQQYTETEFDLQPETNDESFGLCIEDGVEMKEFLQGNHKDLKTLTSKKLMKYFATFGFAVNAIKNTVTFLGQMIVRFTEQVTGPSANVILILLSTIMVISLTDPNENKKKKSRLLRSHVSRPVRGSEKEEDYFPKCTIRERTELPFYRELQSPDVLYGRG